jgi:hypothetical protein
MGGIKDRSGQHQISLATTADLLERTLATLDSISDRGNE